MSDPKKPVSDERKFIHDISTPLSVAFGMIETVLASVAKDGPSLTPVHIERLEKGLKALKATNALVHQRREDLHKKIAA